MNTANLFQFFPKDIARTAIAMHEACPQSDAVIAEVRRLHAEGDDATGYLMDIEDQVLVDYAFDCEADELGCDLDETTGDLAFEYLAAWVQIVVDSQ